ncbi:MAG: M23 family metallopeptidase [Leptospiraceae bacterium]
MLPGVFNASRNAYSSGPKSRTREKTDGGAQRQNNGASVVSGYIPSKASNETSSDTIQRDPFKSAGLHLPVVIGSAICILLIFLTWTFLEGSASLLSPETSLELAKSEMETRRVLLQELHSQQNELHEILKARPAPGIIKSIFQSGDYRSQTDENLISSVEVSGTNDAASDTGLDLRTVYLLEAHLSANQRYLSDGIGVLQAIPHRWPVVGRIRLINSHFGNRKSPFGKKLQYHGGTDLKARSGDSIVATAEGYVYRVGKHGGFGNMVHIIHPSGFETIYAHLSRIDVKKGQEVRAGDVLGKAGDTGITTGPHLHYEVRLDGKRQNPIRYMIP